MENFWKSLAPCSIEVCTVAKSLLATLNGYALLLALVAPILLVYARHEILIRRLRTILDFMQSFKLYGTSDDKGGRYNPSFEFVKSKYVSDIKIGRKEQERLDAIDKLPAPQEEARLKFYIELAAKAGSRSSRQIYLSSIGFMLVSYFGMRSLIGAFDCDFKSVSNCSVAATISDQMLVVGSLAFAGAFVGSLRMLLRCLAVYDLSAFSMLRHTAEMVFTVIIVMLIFRAFPDPMFNVGKLLLPDSVISQIEGSAPAEPPSTTSETPKVQTAENQGSTQPVGLMAKPEDGIPWLWFALAPALGLLPASASRFLLLKMQSLISWMKTTDDRFSSISHVTSLDIIDGIDFETRFRLEECGIYDVQNLATYNPVMLHIETPYGIYQAIDWIAQAQLCHIVGQEKFLMFREVNIRTIFDLERAIDSVASPHAFDNIYASILFAPTDNLKRAAAISQFRFLITDSRNLTRQVSVEEYCAWAREQLRSPVADDATKEAIAENEQRFADAVEHLMVWISDDLHIRRLRRLWIDISSSLGRDAEYFPDSKRLIARIKAEKAEAEKLEAERLAAERAAMAAEEQLPAKPEEEAPAPFPVVSAPADGDGTDAAGDRGVESPRTETPQTAGEAEEPGALDHPPRDEGGLVAGDIEQPLPPEQAASPEGAEDQAGGEAPDPKPGNT